jgi:hypothetical protein
MFQFAAQYQSGGSNGTPAAVFMKVSEAWSLLHDATAELSGAVTPLPHVLGPIWFFSLRSQSPQ